MLHLHLNFIGGRFLDSQSKNRYSKYSPFTGEVMAECCHSDIMDLVGALQLSKKAQIDYAESSLNDRRKLLQSVRDLVDQQKKNIAADEARYTGLSIGQVLAESVEPAIQKLESRITELDKAVAAEGVVYSPVGLVGVVVPWSMTFFHVMDAVSAALASGNDLMINIPLLAPQVVKSVGDILVAAQVPEGLVNLLIGSYESIGDAIVRHPSLRAIKFTGDYKTAERVLNSAGQQQKRIQVSSFGKNIAIRTCGFKDQADADLFFSQIFQGMGQSSWALQKVFILESHQEQFWQMAQVFLSNCKQSSSEADASIWTPVVSAERKEVNAQFLKQIVAEHGKVEAGSELPSAGFFSPPVLIKDLPNCSSYQQDVLELPIVIVTAVKYLHEVSKWANNSYLPGYAWIVGDDEKIRRLAPKLDYALIGLNKRPAPQEVAGLKQSFFGNPEFEAFGSFWSQVKILTH